MKTLFSFFLSLFSWCGALDFLAASHTTMCLNCVYVVIFDCSDLEKLQEHTNRTQLYDGMHGILQIHGWILKPLDVLAFILLESQK